VDVDGPVAVDHGLVVATPGVDVGSLEMTRMKDVVDAMVV
jgi:hypothetical protein